MSAKKYRVRLSPEVWHPRDGRRRTGRPMRAFYWRRGATGRRRTRDCIGAQGGGVHGDAGATTLREGRWAARRIATASSWTARPSPRLRQTAAGQAKWTINYAWWSARSSTVGLETVRRAHEPVYADSCAPWRTCLREDRRRQAAAGGAGHLRQALPEFLFALEGWPRRAERRSTGRRFKSLVDEDYPDKRVVLVMDNLPCTRRSSRPTGGLPSATAPPRRIGVTLGPAHPGPRAAELRNRFTDDARIRCTRQFKGGRAG